MSTKTKHVTDCEKLFQYLDKQFENRLDIKVSFINCIEKIIGTFDDKDISLELGQNGDLCLSTREKDSSFLEGMIPALNIYMNGSGPVVKYDSVNASTGDFSHTSIEWSLSPELKIINLRRKVSLGVKNIVSYYEDKEARDMRLGFTTFSPVLFPDGKLWDFNSFTSMVEDYSEQDCFLALSVLESFQDQVYSRTWRGACPDSVYVSDAIEVVLSKVSLILDSLDDSIDQFKSSEKYRDWYDRWGKYFTYEKKCEYMEAKINGEDLSSFVPSKASYLKKVNN